MRAALDIPVQKIARHLRIYGRLTWWRKPIFPERLGLLFPRPHLAARPCIFRGIERQSIVYMATPLLFLAQAPALGCHLPYSLGLRCLLDKQGCSEAHLVMGKRLSSTVADSESSAANAKFATAQSYTRLTTGRTTVIWSYSTAALSRLLRI